MFKLATQICRYFLSLSDGDELVREPPATREEARVADTGAPCALDPPGGSDPDGFVASPRDLGDEEIEREAEGRAVSARATGETHAGGAQSLDDAHVLRSAEMARKKAFRDAVGTRPPLSKAIGGHVEKDVYV